MSDPPASSKSWLVRATSQFARTVYSELRRAGHGKGDVLRFINEMMDLLSRDAGSDEPTIDPPALIDPEGGLPDRDTIGEIFEVELRRWLQDRRQERLAVMVFDLVLPSWISGSVHLRAHELLCAAVIPQLRRTDTLGKLGPDRYLLVAPRAKEGVVPALLERMQRLVDQISAEAPRELQVAVRCVMCDAQSTSLMSVLERCFAGDPVMVAPRATHPPVARDRAVARPAQVRDIVLALGGGAARAVSHAGVFRELADARVRVTGVAGCSAGGIVGAMFVRGMTPEQIADRFTAFSSTPTYREMRRSYAGFVREARSGAARARTRYFGGTSMAFYSETALAAVSTELLHAFVAHFVGPDCDLHALPVPFSVTATDLIEGRASVLSHGSLHAALAATCAVPGLFPPQAIGDRLLVDGAAVAELPVGAAQLLGVNAPVLAIYMGRPSHRVVSYQSSAEVATRSNALAHAELVREQLRHAEYLISVPVAEVGWLDFRQADKICALGREAAREALPDILDRMDAVAARALAATTIVSGP